MFVKNEILREGDTGQPTGGVDVQTQVNESTSVPMHSNVDPVTDDGFTVPEEYKDRGYLKDVKSMDDVYKKLDGAQSLIGKQKVTFPTDDTSDEDRLAFNLANGMPEKSEDYEFIFAEGAQRDEGFESRIKDLFHSADVTGKSATKIQQGFDQIMGEMEAAVNEQRDVEFGELTTEVFGDKADSILAESKELIDENIPEQMVEAAKGLSNEALVVLASVLKNVKTKYIDEDSIHDRDTDGGSSGAEDLRQKAMDLRNTPAYKDAFHKDHKKVDAEIKEIYARIAKAS
ncbi:MAG: hypothetical protein HOL31_02115 [Candidatus Scalindua sp.]|jgi:hypothetical protein|nr:hypothetical protein [Candidatus Scalindua sp.]MBT7349698.1 hypothetical protein [candidate division WWE3 bacterium]